MDNCTTYVAMDTHKKQHNVALLDRGTGEIRQFSVKNTGKDIAKMVKSIARQAPAAVKFCYEAGVCGFTLQRRIEAMGHQCSVIAPSLVPVKPGDRIKTDRRDAKRLLGHFAAGQLTEVYPPKPQQETDRELTRCRGVAQENLKRTRHQGPGGLKPTLRLTCNFAEALLSKGKRGGMTKNHRKRTQP